MRGLTPPRASLGSDEPLFNLKIIVVVHLTPCPLSGQNIAFPEVFAGRRGGGISLRGVNPLMFPWIPAFAGMTGTEKSLSVSICERETIDLRRRRCSLNPAP